MFLANSEATFLRVIKLEMNEVWAQDLANIGLFRARMPFVFYGDEGVLLSFDFSFDLVVFIFFGCTQMQETCKLSAK